jgi:hypothetical protein
MQQTRSYIAGYLFFRATVAALGLQIDCWDVWHQRNVFLRVGMSPLYIAGQFLEVRGAVLKGLPDLRFFTGYMAIAQEISIRLD